MNTTSAQEPSIKNHLREEMIAAMKAKEKLKLETVRMAIAAIKQIEIDERIELNDLQSIQVLNKLVKQRAEAIPQYLQVGRPELAEKEQQEIAILTFFLPTQLSPDEVEKYIENVFQKLNPAGIKDMGKIMNELKAELEGRADMAEISKLVKSKLSR